MPKRFASWARRGTDGVRRQSTSREQVSEMRWPDEMRMRDLVFLSEKEVKIRVGDLDC